MDIEITEGTLISKLQSASPLSKLIIKIRPFRVKFLLIELVVNEESSRRDKNKNSVFRYSGFPTVFPNQ